MTSDRFIPGIFNYCDYWCERCAFTRRCRNYQMGRALKRKAREPDDAGDQDATNAAFWAELAEQVREVSIFGKPDDWGSEAETDSIPAPDPEWMAREETRRTAVRQHPLVRRAFEYMQRAKQWLDTSDADLKAVARDLLETACSPVPNQAEETARDIGDMIDIVAWYHTLIPPKLSRAIDGLLEQDEPDGEFAEIVAETRLQDANGSGRIVLLAIERSIAAWMRLREILPAHEDAILDMLVLLDRLRAGIHLALPGARAFRLPFIGE